MNNQFQNILEKVNKKLEEKPLIYFCREAERALGLEDYLKNYHICCIEDSYIVDQLIANNISVFCLEKHEKVINKTTTNLISNSKTIRWLKDITKDKSFYAMTFLPTHSIKYKLEKLGGELLNVDYELNQKYENKISQVELFSKNGICYPKTIQGEIQNFSYEALLQELGEKFVIQTGKTHTGSGTYFINTKEEFEKAKKALAGNIVRLSAKVEGYPLTFNILINNSKYLISSPQYQITGIQELTVGLGSTVGNDFSYGWEILKNIPDSKEIIISELAKISKMLIHDSYKGIFGVDLILSHKEAFIIEINARQTANIPFQTKLEISANKNIPLLLLHIAIFLNISIDEIEYENLNELKGSQIFLRAKKENTLIKNLVKSGIYRLQSDNSAIIRTVSGEETKENTIFIDEEKDMPLIFQEDGYRVDKVKAGFILIVQNSGSIKNKSEEIARMQFNTQIIYNENVNAWILKALKTIEETILN